MGLRGKAADSFYKQPPLFSTAPSEKASSQLIARFRPVGIPLCEYYLRTGDLVALPIIQSWVKSAAKIETMNHRFFIKQSQPINP